MAWLTLLIKSGIVLVLFSLTCIDGLENLALRRPAWEQHPWPYTDKDYGSQNAVDGDYSDRSAAGGQCSISADNNYTEATWGVDLGEVVSISHIDIFYRTDNEKTPTTFTSRMAGFSLYVSNTTSKDDGHLCFHEIQNTVGTPSEDQRIQCPFHARYVIYYNERRPEVVYPSYYSEFAYSDLCEVKVYGCRNPGYFGSDCNLMCPSNCQEKRCNINTGYCLGCLPGYKDQSCKHICDKLTYGLECALNCGECRDGTSCHHVNGTCTHGCADGLYGDMCQKECPIGYYGRNCLQRCSENCYVTSRCDRVTGQCDRGCKQGWRTITCDQKCEIGYFGPDCLTKCGHCLNASFCHHINGSCLNGCSKGFKGEYCTESCPHGYFGLDCLHKCSTYCSGNGSCSRFTGVCDEGCKDGWSGLQCGTRMNTECEIGYFGPDCLKKCGHCFNTSQCNYINGSCLNGCSKGYKGKYCKELCAKGYFGIDCVHKCSTYCSGNGSCSHITGVCYEGCKDGWSGSKCGTSINSEGLNGLIPIIIGIGSGIGIVIVGVVLYFALSKIRQAKDIAGVKIEEKATQTTVPQTANDKAEDKMEEKELQTTQSSGTTEPPPEPIKPNTESRMVTESDGRDKIHSSASKSFGYQTKELPFYREDRGNGKLENKNINAEDKKNDKDTKTNKESSNLEPPPPDNYNDPSPSDLKQKSPNISKRRTAKSESDCRTKVPCSDCFGTDAGGKLYIEKKNNTVRSHDTRGKRRNRKNNKTEHLLNTVIEKS